MSLIIPVPEIGKTKQVQLLIEINHTSKIRSFNGFICKELAFLLFFMKIENTVYTSFQNSTLLFINGLIFDIMNVQNNQSLEFE